MNYFKWVLIGVLLISACQKKKSGGGSEEPSIVPNSEIPRSPHQSIEHGEDPTVPEAPTEEVEELIEGEGFPLTRVSPEQLSKNLKAVLGLEYSGFDNYAGQRIDYLLSLYGVALGGIDFNTVSRRDSSTKAQTLLVARVIAWTMAAGSFYTDIAKDASRRYLFTACDPWSELPGSPGEDQWHKQIEEFFWRFYARPPTDEELSAVKETFLIALDHEPNPAGAWIAILYALISSQEFWNI